jgi:hypothetical protein
MDVQVSVQVPVFIYFRDILKIGIAGLYGDSIFILFSFFKIFVLGVHCGIYKIQVITIYQIYHT